MPAVAVRARDVLARPQRLVGEHVDGDTDRADRATARAEDRPDLLVGRGPVSLAQGGHELLLAQPVIAADQRQDEPSPTITGIAFDVAAGSMSRNSASASIVVAPGVSTSSGFSKGSGNFGALGIPRAAS